MTRALAAHVRRRPASDNGFTLIEVIVSLFLLGAVAAAVLVFFVRGMQATSHLQRTQSADAVAMQAMEQVRSVSAQAGTVGVSGVLRGRTQGAVKPVWDAADSVDTQGSTMAWDPAALVNDPTVPISSDVTDAGISYHVTTLIGYCFRDASHTGAAQTCTATDASGSGVKILRATVVVTWKPTSSGQCSSALCTYRTSALIDPNADATWNLTTNPVAFDDDFGTETFAGGDAVDRSVDIPVMSNDIIGPVTGNPISYLTNGSHGSTSVFKVTDTSSGTAVDSYLIHYTPTTGSGTDTFTYRLKDQAGRSSNDAIVTIKVRPKAVSFTASPAVGYTKQSNIDVAAYALGSFGGTSKVTITANPSSGQILGISGTTVTYKAPSTGSSDSFRYTVTDASGLISDEGSVTIPLTAPPQPSPPLAITVDAGTSSVNLDILNRSSSPATSKVFVGGPLTLTPAAGWGAQGTLSYSPGQSAVLFQPTANTVGISSFTYYVQDLAGQSSTPNTVTLTLAPKAVDDLLTIKRSKSGSTSVGANDAPNTGMTYTQGAFTGAACKSPAINSATGLFTMTAPSSTGSCTVSYTISKKVGATTLSSSANVIVTVN